MCRFPASVPTPHDNYKIGGVVLNSDQIAVFVVAALAAIVLWFVIRRTRVGLEMRAVVDRESLANIRGVNAARTSAAAWIMTMVLAGLGGVLIAPLFQLQDIVFTFVVLGSLAAVVLGGPPIDSDRLRRWAAPRCGPEPRRGLQRRHPAQVLEQPQRPQVVGAVPARHRAAALHRRPDRSRRAGSVADDVPPPDHREGLSKLRRRLPWAIWTFILIAFSLGWFGWDWLRADTYDQTVIAQSLAMAIIFLSFVVVTGMGGQVSLMQASFVTAGGFAAGWALTHDFGVDIPGVVRPRPASTSSGRW